MSETRPIAAVGIVCMRGEEVLLIRRGAAPFENQWSLPGGRIEWGETARAAALRELKEETGCDAELIGLVDVVDAVISARSGEGPPWGHYVLIDYAARWIASEPVAGDDAREARFFALAEIETLGLWEETTRVIQAAVKTLSAV
jgi:8-oxo-dGTP diphosphatase